MAFSARAAELTQLQLENATTPGTYDTIASILTVEAPETSYEAVETSLLGPGPKTFRQSKKADNGELTFTIQADPNDAASLVTYARIRDLVGTKNWRVVYEADPATPTVHPCDTMAAFVTSFKRPGGDEDANLEADVTLKVTGAITSGTATIP